MHRKIYYLFLLIPLLAFVLPGVQAQTLTTDPATFGPNDEVTFTFDVSGNSTLEGLSEAWVWVWKEAPATPEATVPTNVNPADANADGAKLTKGDNNTWTITFTPAEFMTIPDGKLDKMGILMKGKDWSNGQTSDFILEVVQEGQLSVSITAPVEGSILEEGEQITIEATSSLEADLSLWVNDAEVKQSQATTTISYTHTVTSSGTVKVEVKAVAGEQSVVDQKVYTVKPTVEVAARPAGLHLGVNYDAQDPTKATLVLQDPVKKKEFVYLIGDFNDWEASEEYVMKKSEEADANYFWLEITGLESGKEYIYQYLIDGNIRIADPYTEKVSDPFDDKYINSGIIRYPNLIAYPEGKTTYRASVLQTNQEAYTWQVTDFVRPAKEELVVYEMHIRDFTDEDTYKAAMARLDHIDELGANAIHLMPINEFEGNDSWGYNPNFYFAPDKYYGTKNDLKAFIDECHSRGIAVVIDMVLNHSYHSSPFNRMYNDGDFGDPTADNPWYNTTSPNTVFSWGVDFDHESVYTQALLDSVNAHWVKEYHIDGYRFDFTKGFTNTPGDGGAYDAKRIELLKRMADELWKVDQESYVILEHFAPLEEEEELTDHGMMVWGNINHDFRDTGKGGSASLDWQYYANRGMNEKGLMSYMESHDEERMMYDALNYGLQQGTYDVQEKVTALERMKLNAAFFFPIPGPKMIWQFGELGYDVSINQVALGGTVDEGNRTGRKPVLWEYKDDADRLKLYQVYQALIGLRAEKGLSDLAPEDVTLDMGAGKSIKTYALDNGDFGMRTIGNFGLSPMSVAYDYSGKSAVWYNFFDGGNEVEAKGSLILGPGEFVVLVNQQVAFPQAGLTAQQGAAVAVEPARFKKETPIKVVFDANFGDATLADASEIYMVAGVVTEAPDSETLVSIVDDNTKGKMTKNADGLWELSLTPSEYFALDANVFPFRMGVTFRNADGSVTVNDQGKPFFFAVESFPEELYLVGSMVDWDLAQALPMTNVSPGIYEVEVSITTTDDFKLIDALSWDVGNEYGSEDGTNIIEADGFGGEISLPAGLSSGRYKLTADFLTLTLSYQLLGEIDITLPEELTFNPENWAADKTLTITFDATGTPVEGVSDLYLWSWVDDGSEEQPGDQNNGEWAASSDAAKWTNNNDGTYSITMVPTEYYATTKEVIDTYGISFLLKSKDGSSKTSDYGPFKPNTISSVAPEFKTVPLRLAPNPASTQVNVLTDNHVQIERISIISLSGAEIKRYTPQTKGKATVDASLLKDGLYIMQVETNEGIRALRLFIRH
ncbi:alpha-amylase family glycosyl hydrolase [Algivirga pacifica]